MSTLFMLKMTDVKHVLIWDFSEIPSVICVALVETNVSSW